MTAPWVVMVVLWVTWLLGLCMGVRLARASQATTSTRPMGWLSGRAVVQLQRGHWTPLYPTYSEENSLPLYFGGVPKRESETVH